MKAKISGIVALVGAALVAVYGIITLIDVIPIFGALIEYGAISSIIAIVILVIAVVLAIVGAIRALLKKDLASQIIRGIAAVLLIVFGAMTLFEVLMIIGLVVLAASIALDYLVK